MHLIFFVRGIKQQIDLFEMFMQTQMFKWERWNIKTKQKEIIQVQGALRVLPIGYEYVFPDTALNEVLTMLHAGEMSKRWNLGKMKNWFIRLALGKGDAGDKVEPLPKFYYLENVNRYIEMKGVALYLIGTKKDNYGVIEDYLQELL